MSEISKEQAVMRFRDLPIMRRIAYGTVMAAGLGLMAEIETGLPVVTAPAAAGKAAVEAVVSFVV